MYRAWDDPAFRNPCRRLSIDPDKQRPTFDDWCREPGEELLETAMAAFEAERIYKHVAAGRAAEALARRATPKTNPIGVILPQLDEIREENLRERTRAALEQLQRLADWQAGKQRTEASRMLELIDNAKASGTSLKILGDADGQGGAVVFGDIGNLDLKSRTTWWDRMKRSFGK